MKSKLSLSFKYFALTSRLHSTFLEHCLFRYLLKLNENLADLSRHSYADSADEKQKLIKLISQIQQSLANDSAPDTTSSPGSSTSLQLPTIPQTEDDNGLVSISSRGDVEVNLENKFLRPNLQLLADPASISEIVDSTDPTFVKLYAHVGVRFVKILNKGEMLSGVATHLYKTADGKWMNQVFYDNEKIEQCSADSVRKLVRLTLEEFRIDRYRFPVRLDV